MADRQIKSITFPDLPDRYTFLQSDTTLTQAGKAADAKEVGDRLASMNDDITEIAAEGTVPTSEQMLSGNYTEDSVPYHFRRTASDNADREELEIVGGSVAWNQLISALPATTTSNGVTFINNGDGSITASGTATGLAYANIGAASVYAGHKYLFAGCPRGGSASTYYMAINGGSATITGVTQDTGKGTIFAATADGTPNYSAIVISGTTVSNLKYIPQMIDLTTMFGTTIADYIYSLEQSSAGAGVTLFRKLFPEDYYAHNTGTMMHVSGVSAKKNVVKNLFLSVSDNVALGYRLADGSLVSSTANCSPNNPIYIKAGKEVTISLNKAIGNIGYVVTSISGEAIARVNTANTSVAVVPAHAQDIYLYVWFNDSINFTIETAAEFVRTTEVQIEIGNERTEYIGEPHIYPLDSTLTLLGIPKLDSNNQLYFDGDVYSSVGKVTRKYGIRAYQSGDTTDGSTMITDGTNTVYKLTTPTTEDAEPYTKIQICDPNGTEEFVSTGIVPVGHVTKYPDNLRMKLDNLPWNFARLIAPVEKTFKATQPYDAGRRLIINNVLYKVTASIANGANIVVGTNVAETNIDELLAELAQ